MIDPLPPQKSVTPSPPASASDSGSQRAAPLPEEDNRSQRAATSLASVSDACSQRMGATMPASAWNNASRRSAASPALVMDTASQRSAASVNSELDPVAPSPYTRSRVAHWIDNLGRYRIDFFNFFCRYDGSVFN